MCDAASSCSPRAAAHERPATAILRRAAVQHHGNVREVLCKTLCSTQDDLCSEVRAVTALLVGPDGVDRQLAAEPVV